MNQPHVFFSNAKPRFAAFHPCQPICAVVMKHESQVSVFNYNPDVATKGIRVFSLNGLHDENRERELHPPTTDLNEKSKKGICGEVKDLEFFDCASEYAANSKMCGMSNSHSDFLKCLREYTAYQTYGCKDTEPPRSMIYIKVTCENKIILIPYTAPDPAMAAMELPVPIPPDRSKISFLVSKVLSVARSTIAVALSDGTLRLWKIDFSDNQLVSATAVGSSLVTCISDMLLPHSNHKTHRCILVGDQDCSIHGFYLQNDNSIEMMMVRFLRIKRSNFHQKPVGSIVSLCTKSWRRNSDGPHVTVATTGAIYELKNLKIGDSVQGNYTLVGGTKKKSTIVGAATMLQEGDRACTTLRAYESGTVKLEQPDGSEETFNLQDKKHNVHAYSVTQHPLDPFLVGVTTNIGFAVFSLRCKTVKNTSITVPFGPDHLLHYVNISPQNFQINIRQGAKGGHSCYLPKPDGDFIKVFEAPHRQFSAMTSSRRLYLYEIHNSDDAIAAVSKGFVENVQSFAWHWEKTYLAVTHNNSGSEVVLYDVSSGSLQEVRKKTFECSQAGLHVFGGKWLAVKSETNMYFISWNTLEIQSPNFPPSENVLWDPYSGNCAFIYPDTVAVMSADASTGIFSSLVQIPVECEKLLSGIVTPTCCWVHGTLIIDTGVHIGAYFPRKGAYECCTIAVSYGPGGIDAYDLIVTHNTASPGTAALEHIRVTGGMQARPQGSLDILGFVSDSLLVKSSTGHSHLKLSPALKWRYCAQAGKIKSAMDWIGIAGISPYEVATFLGTLGYVKEALAVPGLTITCKAEISNLVKNYTSAVKYLTKVNTPFESLTGIAEASEGTDGCDDCYLLVAKAGA